MARAVVFVAKCLLPAFWAGHSGAAGDSAPADGHGSLAAGLAGLDFSDDHFGAAWGRPADPQVLTDPFMTATYGERAVIAHDFPQARSGIRFLIFDDSMAGGRDGHIADYLDELPSFPPGAVPHRRSAELPHFVPDSVRIGIGTCLWGNLTGDTAEGRTRCAHVGTDRRVAVVTFETGLAPIDLPEPDDRPGAVIRHTARLGALLDDMPAAREPRATAPHPAAPVVQPPAGANLDAPACSSDFDPAVVGRWDMWVNLPQTGWTNRRRAVRPDASYTFEQSGQQIHAGRFIVTGGTWTMTSTTGLPRQDASTYQMPGDDILDLAGRHGAGTWQRLR